MDVTSKLVTIWVQLRDMFLYWFRGALIINAYVDDHTWQGIRHRNWGDDLNYYFIRELTGRPVVLYHNFKLAQWLHLKNYLCIGTLLDAVNYSNRQTVVWGTGVSGQERSFVHPRQICSVRGPQTRAFVERYGVACPNIYGDPAMLLPLVYKPKKQKTYKWGLIPHVVDLHHPVVEDIRANHPEVLVIDLAHYEHWTDVIDKICSCEQIASSSLHGLIVSDAYDVPNSWVELSGKISGGYFKFRDYGASVGRHMQEPVRLKSFSDMDQLKTDVPGSKSLVNTDELLKSCPLPVCKRYRL